MDRTVRQVAFIAAAWCGLAGAAAAVVLTGGSWTVYLSKLLGVSGAASGGDLSVRHQVAHSYGIDGTAMSGGTYTLGPVLVGDGPVLTPVARPPLVVDPGEVKVMGGRQGYLDIRQAESAEVLFNPRETGQIAVRIFTVRGRLVLDRSVECTAGVQTGFAWDGRNASGEPVAAGVYLVRVSGAGLNALRRVAVVR